MIKVSKTVYKPPTKKTEQRLNLIYKTIWLITFLQDGSTDIEYCRFYDKATETSKHLLCKYIVFNYKFPKEITPALNDVIAVTPRQLVDCAKSLSIQDSIKSDLCTKDLIDSNYLVRYFKPKQPPYNLQFLLSKTVICSSWRSDFVNKQN